MNWSKQRYIDVNYKIFTRFEHRIGKVFGMNKVFYGGEKESLGGMVQKNVLSGLV